MLYFPFQVPTTDRPTTTNHSSTKRAVHTCKLAASNFRPAKPSQPIVRWLTAKKRSAVIPPLYTKRIQVHTHRMCTCVCVYEDILWGTRTRCRSAYSRRRIPRRHVSDADRHEPSPGPVPRKPFKPWVRCIHATKLYNAPYVSPSSIISLSWIEIMETLMLLLRLVL